MSLADSILQTASIARWVLEAGTEEARRDYFFAPTPISRKRSIASLEIGRASCRERV